MLSCITMLLMVLKYEYPSAHDSVQAAYSPGLESNGGSSPDFMDSMINLCVCASSPEDAGRISVWLTPSCISLLLLPSQGSTQQG